MKLNESKTGIVPFSEKAVTFLGYSLQGPYKKGATRGTEVIVEKNSGRRIRRRKKERMSMFMNMSKVLQRMENNGFIRKRIRPGSNDETIYRGTFRGNMINMDHADILRSYSATIRGLYNYYRYVNNMDKLAKVI